MFASLKPPLVGHEGRWLTYASPAQSKLSPLSSRYLSFVALSLVKSIV